VHRYEIIGDNRVWNLLDAEVTSAPAALRKALQEFGDPPPATKGTRLASSNKAELSSPQVILVNTAPCHASEPEPCVRSDFCPWLSHGLAGCLSQALSGQRLFIQNSELFFFQLSAFVSPPRRMTT
jgi:hypothetical protein